MARKTVEKNKASYSTKNSPKTGSQTGYDSQESNRRECNKVVYIKTKGM